MDNGINSIIAWGDSILRGAISCAGEAGFEITDNDALTLAADALSLQVINKSVYGASLINIRRTQEHNLRKGLFADIALIESGSNDCEYDWDAVNASPESAHEPACGLEKFVRLLEEIISISRENKITPVVTTLPPLVIDAWFKTVCVRLDENAILKFLSFDKAKLYRNQELYSLAAAKTAVRLNAQIIDFRSAFLRYGDFESLVCPDGIHPNEEGHKLMASVLIEELPRLRKEF